METATKTTIIVETTVQAPVEKVWEFWNEPKHITQWCHASADWHAPRAENDLREGGTFTTTMAAKDGSFSFDFGGVYTQVETNKVLAYTMGDGRKVTVLFQPEENATHVVESFEAENTHSEEMQRTGWQAILDNFKNYVEAN
ncbi:MAG: polyketide cyclase [Chitinophagaceae bacterium]|nr:MAG: polyketide cyclase [Chitinophagaceae bacterium]